MNLQAINAEFVEDTTRKSDKYSVLGGFSSVFTLKN